MESEYSSEISEANKKLNFCLDLIMSVLYFKCPLLLNNVRIHPTILCVFFLKL